MSAEGTNRQATEHIDLAGYERYLKENERSAGTVAKYLRDVRSMVDWVAGQARAEAFSRDSAELGIPPDTVSALSVPSAPPACPSTRILTKEALLHWRAHLQERGLIPRTINAMLSAVNSFLCYLGKENCRVHLLKVQRRLFRTSEKDLTRTEYGRLLNTASEQGKRRLCLLMETICATGIRVSELRYITVEALQKGQAEITSKGKVRTILLSGKLCQKLKKYIKAQKIISGVIFRTRSGQPLSRRQIWAEMKSLCAKARVDASKVYPHNLRHLFATLFYDVCGDIVKLADVLGHSSIETTRIYLISTGREHRRLLERMRLVQ